MHGGMASYAPAAGCCREDATERRGPGNGAGVACRNDANERRGLRGLTDGGVAVCKDANEQCKLRGLLRGGVAGGISTESCSQSSKVGPSGRGDLAQTPSVPPRPWIAVERVVAASCKPEFSSSLSASRRSGVKLPRCTAHVEMSSVGSGPPKVKGSK